MSKRLSVLGALAVLCAASAAPGCGDEAKQCEETKTACCTKAEEAACCPKKDANVVTVSSEAELDKALANARFWALVDVDGNPVNPTPAQLQAVRDALANTPGPEAIFTKVQPKDPNNMEAGLQIAGDPLAGKAVRVRVSEELRQELLKTMTEADVEMFLNPPPMPPNWRTANDLEVIDLPDGSKQLKSAAGFNSYTFATINADGSVAAKCVTSPAEYEKFLRDHVRTIAALDREAQLQAASKAAAPVTAEAEVK